MTAAEALRLHVDGASRGNPGEAGFGVHVTAPDGARVAGLYGYLGRATNNVAEYQALLHGLRFALARGARGSRSSRTRSCWSGSWRVATASRTPACSRCYREAQPLFARFERARSRTSRARRTARPTPSPIAPSTREARTSSSAARSRRRRAVGIQPRANPTKLIIRPAPRPSRRYEW